MKFFLKRRLDSWFTALSGRNFEFEPHEDKIFQSTPSPTEKYESEEKTRKVEGERMVATQFSYFSWKRHPLLEVLTSNPHIIS